MATAGSYPLSFTMALQKPISDITETTSIFQGDEPTSEQCRLIPSDVSDSEKQNKGTIRQQSARVGAERGI